MLTEQQLIELREHLERAHNPVFYYDNDADGLCSFLLFRRALGRGKGVAIRSYPDLNESYAQRAEEFGADYVFILDKPVLSKAFVDVLARLHIPIVWIDHHDVPGQDFNKEYDKFFIYNPTRNSGKDKSAEPVTYLTHRLLGRVEDTWLAVMGCIADHYLPDFASVFAKQYPELWGSGIKKPFDAYYATEIGKIAQALNFGLKDSITNVVRLQQHLVQCQQPNDVLAEHPGNQTFRAKYSELRKRYDTLLQQAHAVLKDNLLFFSYAGETSMSADLSNELCYRHPEMYVAVAYINGAITNISLRGRDVKHILEKILPEFVQSSGGGHTDACGARIRTEDLNRFKEALEKAV
ncbi:DHH family phosphoesterase [Candidatus Pacearchaeota archaeon]|nr:DHH family phosphoesterase [Candidatus Pacearchaeota archaeon]